MGTLNLDNWTKCSKLRGILYLMPTTTDKKEPEYITLDFTIRNNLAAITLVLAVRFYGRMAKLANHSHLVYPISSSTTAASNDKMQLCLSSTEPRYMSPVPEAPCNYKKPLLTDKTILHCWCYTATRQSSWCNNRECQAGSTTVALSNILRQ